MTIKERMRIVAQKKVELLNSDNSDESNYFEFILHFIDNFESIESEVNIEYNEKVEILKESYYEEKE